MESRLYRSRKNKMIGGVAGGLAEYFNVDPVIIRLLFIVAIFGFGASILIYIVLMIITPVAPLGMTESSEGEIPQEPNMFTRHSSRKSRSLMGYLLILFGLLGVSHHYIPNFDFSDVISVVLVCIGAFIIFAGKNRNINNGDEEAV